MGAPIHPARRKQAGHRPDRRPPPSRSGSSVDRAAGYEPANEGSTPSPNAISGSAVSLSGQSGLFIRAWRGFESRTANFPILFRSHASHGQFLGAKGASPPLVPSAGPALLQRRPGGGRRQSHSSLLGRTAVGYLVLRSCESLVWAKARSDANSLAHLSEGVA